MKAGIHALTMAEYQALPFLSSGLCKTLLSHSPLHAWTESALNPARVEKEKQEFDLGAASHANLFEGGSGIVIINPEEHRSKPTKANPEGNIPKGFTNDAIKAARDAVREQGKMPVLPSQMVAIERMTAIARQAIAECPDLGGLTLADGQPEQSIIWEEGGIFLKTRPDWMSGDRAVQISYKTTARSANPEDFIRQVISMGYDVQDALYLRGNAATGGPDDALSIMLVQENEPPYAAVCVTLDPAFLALGAEKVEAAIALWAKCVKDDKWPSYSPRLHWIARPVWAQAQWEEREVQNKMLSDEDLADGVPA